MYSSDAVYPLILPNLQLANKSKQNQVYEQNGHPVEAMLLLRQKQRVLEPSCNLPPTVTLKESPAHALAQNWWSGGSGMAKSTMALIAGLFWHTLLTRLHVGSFDVARLYPLVHLQRKNELHGLKDILVRESDKQSRETADLRVHVDAGLAQIQDTVEREVSE